MSLEDGFPAIPPARETRAPRYVPTLTEVVSEGGVQAPAAPAAPEPPTIPPADGPAPAPSHDALVWPGEASAPEDDEERLLRVLQRVEVLLDRRLSAAVAQAAESVSREFARRLKAEMEPLIREAVSEAMAEELNPTNHPRE